MILERGKFVPLQKSLQTLCVATDFASKPILCAWQSKVSARASSNETPAFTSSWMTALPLQKTFIAPQVRHARGQANSFQAQCPTAQGIIRLFHQVD